MKEIEDLRTSIADDSTFTPEESAIIKVVGVGGGGSNAVSYMYSQNIPHVDFVICNTDKQALEISPVPNKVILGYDLTKGLGAGNIPSVGRECAELSEEALKALFQPPTEMVFITAGMGGGTGTGAAPVVARIAKSQGMLTIGIVTIPFRFETDQKVYKAYEGVKEMQKHVDALLVINNENLIELYPDLDFFNAFHKADDTLANAARSISEIISENCYVNVDFHDVQTTLRDSGTAIISTAYGEGEHRISKAIHNALHSPLLKAHDIKTSTRLLLKFSCARETEHPLRTEEINEIRQFTAQMPNIDVKWGIADDPSLGDTVKITILAAGFDLTVMEREGKKEKTVLSGTAEPAPDDTIFFGDPTDAKKKEKEAQAVLEELYGADILNREKRDNAKLKYAVLKPEQFDDEDLITKLERIPTAERDLKANTEILASSDKGSASFGSDSRFAPGANPADPNANTIVF